MRWRALRAIYGKFLHVEPSVSAQNEALLYSPNQAVLSMPPRSIGFGDKQNVFPSG